MGVEISVLFRFVMGLLGVFGPAVVGGALLGGLIWFAVTVAGSPR